jgi:hypothetical protein
MGILDWFRRRSLATAGGEETPPAHRAHGEGVEAGSTAEGPPAGMSDPGSLTGEDAPQPEDRPRAD